MIFGYFSIPDLDGFEFSSLYELRLLYGNLVAVLGDNSNEVLGNFQFVQRFLNSVAPIIYAAIFSLGNQYQRIVILFLSPILLLGFIKTPFFVGQGPFCF